MGKQSTSDYCVYKHIAPDGRYYIGLSSNISLRWGSSGSHYKDAKLFYSCIEEYGWNNIMHIVLHSNLTLPEAQELERKYIQEAKDAGISLNRNSGGSHGSRQKRSIETRIRIGNAHRGLRYTRSKNLVLKEDSKWHFVPIEIYKNGQLVGKYDSLHQAAKESGITRRSMQRSIRSGRPTKCGYLIIKI